MYHCVCSERPLPLVFIILIEVMEIKNKVGFFLY